jgi:hypothetical protein
VCVCVGGGIFHVSNYLAKIDVCNFAPLDFKQSSGSRRNAPRRSRGEASLAGENWVLIFLSLRIWGSAY